MLWDISRGFLPTINPIQFLPINKFEDTELIYTWEVLSENIPIFLNQDCLREEMIYVLRKANNAYYFGFLDGLKSQETFERAFLLLSFFANAYVNAPEGVRKKKLPKEISIPLSRAAHLVKRKPILDYTSFCLYNWRLKDKDGSITPDNIEMLLTFTRTPEEQNLFSRFVEFEYASKVLFNNFNLELVYNFICNQNKMFDIEKPIGFGDYFNDFENVIYENCNSEPLDYHCNILLQSPSLHLLYKCLDIDFKDAYLRRRFESLAVPEEHAAALYRVHPIKTRNNKLYRETLLELMRLNDKLILSNSDEYYVSIMNSEIIRRIGG